MRDINAADLRKMSDKEGLIIQGCGGDPQEWIDGINNMLTDEGILLEDTRFQNVSRFQHDGVTNLLFPFEDVKLDVGKLAMWRLKTHEMFGGIWLSDYVDNRLGGFTETEIPESEEGIKPDCPLIGADGNIFNLMSIAKRTLINNDMSTQAKEMCSRIYYCGGYNEALNIIGEYVNITDGSENIDDSEGEVLINHYDRPSAFFYNDPPYISSEYMYECGFGWDDHLRLNRVLKNVQGKCLVSYNDCPEVQELYRDFYNYSFTRVHSMVQKYEAGKEFPEILIANYDMSEREKNQPYQLTLF